jgi:hypothetical protein
MIIKYAIANVKIGDIATMAQDRGLDGSIWSGFGFGAWGVEPTVFIEFATSDIAKHDEFVQKVLFKHRENCAFRIIDGKDGALVYQSSVVTFESNAI